MDIFADFAARVAAALKALYPEAAAELIARAVVEPPRDPAHGDLSSNAAMVVAKPLGKNPREVATALAAHFKADPDVQSVEVAGPGFLNFRLAEPAWHRVLKSVAFDSWLIVDHATRFVLDPLRGHVAVPDGVTGQDEAGRLWDIVWMLRFGILRSHPGHDRIPVALYVRNDNQRSRLIKLIATCGPLDIDDPQPAITVMMPDED